MSSPDGVAERSEHALTVAVLGAATPVGDSVLRALVSTVAVGGVRGAPHRIATLVGVDDEPGEVGGVHYRTADPSSPTLAAALHGVDVVVLLATPWDLDGELRVGARAGREQAIRRAQVAITAAAAVGARQLVAVTSAMVHGANQDNPVPLSDDAPLRAGAEGAAGAVLDVEQLLAVAPEVHPGLRVAVIRPATLVGPGVDTVLTRHFEAPRLLTVKGSTPAWQFLHVDDLGRAVAVAVAQGLEGPLGAGAEGSLTQQEVERLSGMRRVEISEAVALGTAQRLHRVGVLPAPASDLAFVLHPWVVSSATLRAHGWEPAYDNATCLGLVLDQVRGRYAVAARRVDRKDAALGAASAAVAVIGTAALMRRRRRRTP